MISKNEKKWKGIANDLSRDRRTIKREIKKGALTKQIENPYVSRNPKVPDYLSKTVYLADKAHAYADK